MVKIITICCGCGAELTKSYEPKYWGLPSGYRLCELCALKIDNFVLELRKDSNNGN